MIKEQVSQPLINFSLSGSCKWRENLSYKIGQLTAQVTLVHSHLVGEQREYGSEQSSQVKNS